VLSKSCSTRRARYNSRRTVVLRVDARGITVEEPSFCARAASGWLCVALSGSDWLWLALAASGCLWLALAGSGWLWLALGGSGWLWVALAGSGGAPGWLWLALGGSGWLWVSGSGWSQDIGLVGGAGFGLRIQGYTFTASQVVNA
jgi:uncharacterized protein (AIM24 family)